MKKIALFVVAVAVAVAANAQVVVGLQGGFYQQSTFNPMFDTAYACQPDGLLHDRMTTTERSWQTQTWLAGAQIGYQITPKLYAGVSGAYLSTNTELSYLRDSLLVDEHAANSMYVGMWMAVDNHRYLSERTGWQVSPTIRYEVAKYGNMHLNMMIQGTVRSMGYSTYRQYYNKPFDNNEIVDYDPVVDSISDFSWSVSLRPTLTYEFSKHLSAELSLDFLSVGYISNTRHYDGNTPYTYITTGQSGSQEHSLVVPPHDVTETTLYAGLNTLMEMLRWESPMLRLGFNYTF